jgi:hypothetical protein
MWSKYGVTVNFVGIMCDWLSEAEISQFWRDELSGLRTEKEKRGQPDLFPRLNFNYKLS